MKSQLLSYAVLAALLPAAILHPASAGTLGTAFPLYVSNINNNTIVKVDSSGNQTVFASGNNIYIPFGMAFDSSGNLYVASLANNTIVKLDSAGNQTVYASGGSLDGPTGLAFDANDNLYVSNQFGNNIVRVVPGGEQVMFSSGGNLSTPFALAFDAAGNLYAANYTNGGSVIKIDASGNQTVFNKAATPGAQGLAFDSAGNLYVSCSGPSANLPNFVLKLDSNGNFVSVFSPNGSLNGPANLAFDSLGNLYATSSGNASIVRMDSAGAQAVFSSGGNYNRPFGLAFTRLPANGATIAYSGNVTGPEVNQWRNSAVPKAKDLDGDNVYGSWGAVNWPNASPGNTTSFLQNITWVLSAAGAQSTQANYASINQLPYGPANTSAGIALNSISFSFNGGEADYAGKTMRVGIMQDVLDPANAALDTFKGLQVRQLNGSGDSGVIPLRSGGPGTGSPAMYFFDISPVHPGDSFSILAPGNVGGTSGNAGYISAVSFDLGTFAQLQFFPTSLNFGNQQQGTISTPQTVTLTNAGNGPLSINAIATTGDFAQTNNCGASLASGSSCQIPVTFTPQSTGALSGSLTISENSGGGSTPTVHTIALSGTGLGVPVLVISPASLDFGNQQTNTTSAAQTITLTNSSPAGSAALTITSITATGNFAQTNNCPATLGSGASCQINVTFTPRSAASLTGEIVIKDNAGGAPHIVSLTGTGSGVPTGSLSPASLIFPGQQMGTASAPQTVTVSNTGGSALLITSVAVTGPFSQTNNCPASLAPAASCQIAVTFRPQSIGALPGALNITDNNAGVTGSIQTVPLSGTGLGTPTVVLSPTSLTFPVVLTGQTSSQTVTLTNTGTGPLNITAIVVGGSFYQTNNCGSTVAQGASCQFTVTFAPLIDGPRNGVIQIRDNAPGGFQNISLSGTGAFFSVTPPNLNFGNVQPGGVSAPQIITFLNGHRTLTVNSITVSPNFTQTNNCVTPLANGASCQIRVVFTPQAISNYSGTLRINYGISGFGGTYTQTIPLTGIGAAIAKLSTTTLFFTASRNGTKTQSVKLTNTGNIPLVINSISIGGRNPNRFTQTNTCGSSLAAGASCTISVTYHAANSIFSSASAVLNIVDNANPGTQSVTLVGVTF